MLEPKEQLASQWKLVCHNRTQPKRSLNLIRPCTECRVHGQTSKFARTRWLCSGAAQVVRPRSQVQAGADSGGVFYTIRSYCRWAVASLPAKVCCLRGLLPRVVVGPASADTLVRPTKTEFAANTGTRVAPHQEASSANVRRCTTTRPGATDRRPAAAAWTGTAATSCHHRQTTSGLAADSCIILIAGEYLRTWRTLPRVCCLPGKVCTRGV